MKERRYVLEIWASVDFAERAAAGEKRSAARFRYEPVISMPLYGGTHPTWILHQQKFFDVLDLISEVSIECTRLVPISGLRQENHNSPFSCPVLLYLCAVA